MEIPASLAAEAGSLAGVNLIVDENVRRFSLG
jgi:hypothetical protein